MQQPRAARRCRLRHARTARSSAIGSPSGSRISTIASILPTSARCSPLGGSADARRRRVLASARVRQRAARLFVLLHVLHRTARARPFRSSPDGRRSCDDVAASSRGRRARSDAGRPDGQRLERPGAGADFGDLCRAVAALDGPGAPHVHLAASKRFHREDHRRSGRRPAVESAHASAAAVVQRSGAAPHESQVHGGGSSTRRCDAVRRYLPDWAITTDIIVGFPGESEDDFERTLDVRGRGVFANAFTFMYSIRRGTPAAHWEQVPRDVASARFATARRAERRHARLPRSQDRHDRARADRGPSKKDASKLAAKTLDNVTVIAPIPRRLRRSALRARAVARRRDRNGARVGLHRHDRPPGGTLRAAGARRAAPASSLLQRLA